MANGNGSRLNRVKYTGLDFATHTDDVLARLQVKFAADFNDFAVSALGIVLLDLTSYGLDTLTFYLDRRASDAFLDTAVTRKAVSRGSRQLGYKMGGAVASSTNLNVRVVSVKAFTVTIPEGFRFKGPNGLIFEAARDVAFTPAEQSAGAVKDVPIFEGETLNEQFTSDGQPNQVFELRRVPAGKQIVQGTADVEVDGAEFVVLDLLEYGATDQVEVGFNDDPPTMRFGDGISGNIPVLDGTIDISYVASRGLNGQVPEGTIASVDTPLVVAFETITLDITNPTPSVGGDDLETLSRAKAFAPQVWKARNVAVVGGDYAALSGSYSDPLFGRVAVAKALASRSAATDLTLQNLLSTITGAVSSLDADIQAQITALNTGIADLNTALASITAADTATTETSITVAADTARSSAQVARNSTNSLDVDVGDIQNAVTSGKNEVDRFGPIGSAAQGSVAAVAASLLVDGETFTLDDGTNPPTLFEFDTNAVFVGVQVDISAATTAIDVASAMVAAINGVAASLLLTASNGGGTHSIVTIINDQQGAVGNTVWSDTVADSGFVITNPSGGSGGTADLDAAQVASIKEFFDAIDQQAQTILTTSSDIEAQTTTILGQMDGIDGFVTALADIRDDKDTATADASAASANIQTATLAIDALDTDLVADVSEAATAIFDHVDRLLAADCQANLVTVPILTKDAGGFYTAPSTGLIDSLQQFLDERKEVTQTIAVTSGASFLVAAVLVLRVGVRSGFSESVVKASVEVALDGLLRGRAFGAILYELDVEAVVQSVQGVRFSNTDITGPASRLDVSGNLVPLSSEVVTKGTVTINTEPVVEQV